jgi:hypothetical protein
MLISAIQIKTLPVEMILTNFPRLNKRFVAQPVLVGSLRFRLLHAPAWFIATLKAFRQTTFTRVPKTVSTERHRSTTKEHKIRIFFNISFGHNVNRFAARSRRMGKYSKGTYTRRRGAVTALHIFGR